MAILAKIGHILKRLLGIFLILTEFFLAFRFVLKFLDANPLSFAVASLYKLTDYLVWPFQSIFPNLTWQDHLIDIIGVSAMLGYLIAFLLLLGVFKFIFRE